MSKKFTEYSKFDLSIRKRYAGYSPCYRPFD